MAVTINYPDKHTQSAAMHSVSVVYVPHKMLKLYLKDLSIESLINYHVTRADGEGVRLRGSYVPKDGDTINITRYHV